ncbi:MAG TPA: hypothetical protein VII13_09065 [Vicinamibacteria bacterium]|jgi:hypothetical protein
MTGARGPRAALFALALGSYAYFYQAGSWNANTRFDLVRAVVERQTLRIDAYAENTGDRSRRGGHEYSDKAPGIALLSLPAYAVAYAVKGEQREMDRFQGVASWLCQVTAVSLPSAFAAVALFAVLQGIGLGAPAAAALTVAYALGTLAFPYSTLLYGHQTATAFVLVAFARVVGGRAGFAAGALLAGAVVVDYTAAVPAAVVGGYALARGGARLGRLAAGAAIPVIVLAAYHTAAFGHPLALPYGFSIQQPRHRGVFMGLGAPDPRVLYYILVDEYRGLFYGAPWLLLAVPGLVLLLRDPLHRGVGLVSGTVAVFYLWLAASLSDWHGGWAMGPRHLVPALPYLALGVGAVFTRARPRWRRVAAAGAALGAAWSVALMLIGTSVKPEVPRSIEQPWQGFLLPAFAEGRLAQNTQSIDMYTGRNRTARQAWNVGEALGLTGRATLLPLLGWWLAATAWLAAAVRRSDPGQER